MIRRRRRRGIVHFAVVALMAGGPSVSDLSAQSPRQILESGRVRVTVEPRVGGMRIDVDGIPWSRHSELVVTTPPWTPHFYVGPTAEAIAGATVERTSRGPTLRIVHRGQSVFTGVETLILAADGRSLEQTFEGSFSGEGEALIQWRMAALDATLLAGRPYVVGSGGPPPASAPHGIVPVSPQPEGSAEARLASGFASFEVDSRIGPIRIDVESERPLTIMDYRASKWAAPGDAYFWFGDWGSRIRRDRPVRYRVVYRFPPASAESRSSGATKASAKVRRIPAAQTTEWDGPPAVLPRPKEVRWGEREAVLADPARVSFEGAGASAAAAALREAWKTLWNGTAVSAKDESATLKKVVFTIDESAASGRAEGYVLEVTPVEIHVRAADAVGCRHAVRTLQQMSRLAEDGTVRVKAAKITDWPTLRFRGVHLFTGGRGPDLHKRLIRNLLGPLKMNHLVLEAEYIKWDTHPEIHHPQYGMSKEDVREILAVCRAEQIDVTPLINTLGHCQWMFETGHHLDLCEDPEAKWAYCVTEPRTYDFVFAIFEEALELFQPRFLHIGHDEFADRGRVPFRESSLPFTVEQLFMRDTLRLHEWLSARQVRVMMWGDMLLGPGEAPDACHAASVESARRLRDDLPKDILITDWHYAGVPADRFTSLRTFQACGHEVIAATWDRPANIVNFARAAHEAGSLGLLQTTWAGYSLDEESFPREMRQYGAYVLAAEAAWNADRPPALDGHTAHDRFLDFMQLSSLSPANSAGWLADLTSACNYFREAGTPDGWFGLGPSHDLSLLPSGEIGLGGIRFMISPGRGPSLVALHGRLANELRLPAELRVELKEAPEAARLAILHATNFAGGAGTKVGRYEVLFADGSSAGVDLAYGQNIHSYTDLGGSPDSPVLWRGATPAGDPICLRGLIWGLPRPAKPIKSIVFRSTGSGPSPLIFAVTGLTD